MYACLLYAKPCLKPGSSVVTIASIRGQTPSPSGLGYAASKSGVISLTQASAPNLVLLESESTASHPELYIPLACLPIGAQRNVNELPMTHRWVN